MVVRPAWVFDATLPSSLISIVTAESGPWIPLRTPLSWSNVVTCAFGAVPTIWLATLPNGSRVYSVRTPEPVRAVTNPRESYSIVEVNDWLAPSTSTVWKASARYGLVNVRGSRNFVV